MRPRAHVHRQGHERVEQFGGLSCEHRQHLVLEADVAKRHASEMVDINRTVIGSERRRWHPVDPFEMKRHGLAQISLLHRSGRRVSFSQSPKWLMERLRNLPQIGLVLAGRWPQSSGSKKNSEDY